MSGSRRDRAASLLARGPLRTIARRAPRWRGVVVLNYHRIGESAGQPWDHSLWNADAERLSSQLAYLAAEAEVIGPEELAELARSPRGGRHVLLTFDDGYRDNYEIAFPLLREHGLRAAFFPASGFIDGGRAAWWDELAWMVRNATRTSIPAAGALPGPLALGPDRDDSIGVLVEHYKTLPGDAGEGFLERVAEESGAGRCPPSAAAQLWMTWEMLRELRTQGMAIGGHTVTHPVLARLAPEQQEQEIAGCAHRIEQELGEQMRWFAYPVGAADSFTSETKRILREHGVQLAFTFHGGYARLDRWDPLEVPRIHVGEGHVPQLLAAMLALPPLFTRW